MAIISLETIPINLKGSKSMINRFCIQRKSQQYRIEINHLKYYARIPNFNNQNSYQYS